jgi:hypothetical protein
MGISLSRNVPTKYRGKMPTLYGLKAGQKFLKGIPNDNFLKIIYNEM